MSVEGADYPYWKPEFDKEMKGFEVWYKDLEWPKKAQADTADGYSVFMIMCNQPEFYQERSRLMVLQLLKDATEENPIKIGNEIFWTEKY